VIRESTAARLRRLRFWLTVLLTVLNAAGLAVFAGVVITTDTRRTYERLDAQLNRVSGMVTRLLAYDDTLVTDYAAADPLSAQCPQFAILPGAAGEFPAYYSERSCVPMDPALLSGLAELSVRDAKLINDYQRGTGGQLVRVRVEPFRDRTNKYVGAVVAVIPADAAQARHTRLVLLVLGGCALQIALVGGACHVLSGRVIRPGVTALEQQEALLADTAHDLRTPVAALRALAETALDDSDQRDELLTRTVRLAGRMGSIIDALLARARLAAGVEQLAVQPVRLDQLVSVVVEQTPSNGAQVTLTAAPSTVHVDPGLVQRAVGNLLDNAMRHGRMPDAPAVVHITVAGGRVTVADHGPGIDPELAPEAFDRFGSGVGSSGLGLAIVRWVAQAHGGTLKVYNAAEGGAIFELSLPSEEP
jgi:two-component system, OmpR family, sensor kinase